VTWDASKGRQNPPTSGTSGGERWRSGSAVVPAAKAVVPGVRCSSAGRMREDGQATCWPRPRVRRPRSLRAAPRPCAMSSRSPRATLRPRALIHRDGRWTATPKQTRRGQSGAEQPGARVWPYEPIDHGGKSPQQVLEENLRARIHETQGSTEKKVIEHVVGYLGKHGLEEARFWDEVIDPRCPL
jgi:hypothetical protein